MVVADDLRLSILQYAIEGKLSKQLEEDTPVEATLEKLSSIKKHLIQTSAIKKEKPYTGDGTLPFDIPATWRWVRLFDIGELSRGKSKHRPRNDDVLYINGTIPLIQTGDVAAAKKYVKSYGKCYNEIGLAQSRLWKAGTLCITIAANIGDVAILGFDACFPDSVVGFQPFSEDVSTEYIYYMLLAYKQRMNAKATKVAQSNLSLDKISTLFFPFPPIEEQRRISKRLNDLMEQIGEYERVEKQLSELKAAFPTSMRAAVLQAAMQGKLTEQLDTDHPADELLATAVIARKELIESKQIKNERIKGVSEMDYPFDIPSSWRFVRMGQIIKLQSGQDLTPDMYSDEIRDGIPYLTGASNIDSGNVIINRWTTHPRAIAERGDLLLTCKGTVGLLAFLQENAHIARQIMAIRPLASINPHYIMYCIDNFVLRIKSQAKSEIPGIDRKVVLNLLIPIPPLEEQQRIVERLDKLLPLCDELI